VSPNGADVVQRLLAPPLRGWFRITVEGAAHVPGAGGVLLAANHRSFLDHLALAAATPRPLRFLGKAELAQGLGGRLNVLLGMVPVERGRADLRALDEIVALLRRGEAVGVFPEGTRSPTGELFRFRSGLGRIAAAAQAPVVPVALIGTAEAWPRDGGPPRRRPASGTVTVRFGDVLAPPDDDPRSRRAFTETCRARIAELCGQPVAEGFAKVPARSR
jgi:1-acyl-sn-glycerol-3-phosphate acyltransferase